MTQGLQLIRTAFAGYEDSYVIIDGTACDISVLNEKYLIPFKAKAWLDLNAREQHGEHVDGKDLKKHKYDVFRLAQLLAPEDRVSLNDEAYHDLADFLGEISHETLPMKQLGIGGTQQDIIDLIAGVYQLSIPPRDESSTTMSA